MVLTVTFGGVRDTYHKGRCLYGNQSWKRISTKS